MHSSRISAISESFSFLMVREKYQPLILGLGFLETISRIIKNEDVDERCGRVVNDVFEELGSLSSKPGLTLDLNSVRGMMKNGFFNPETQEYDVISLPAEFKDVLKFNENLVKNFGDFLQADLVSPLIREKLFFLEALLAYVAKVGEHIGMGVEHKSEVFATIHALIDKSASLLYYCMVEEINGESESLLNHNLSKLLEKNKVKDIYYGILRISELSDSGGNPLEEEFYLLDHLIKTLESCTIEDPRMKLHDNLEVLKTFLSELPFEVIVEQFTYLVRSTEAIISGAILIIYSCYDKDIKEEMSGEVNGLVGKIKYLREVKLREMKLYNYPKTDELGFLDFFLDHLEELLKSQLSAVYKLKSQIKDLHDTFGFLRSFLQKNKETHIADKTMEDLKSRIIGLAYEAEYIIDFFIVKDASDSRVKLSISNVINQTKLIMESTNVNNGHKKKCYTPSHGVAKSSNHLPSQATHTIDDQAVVGFEDEAEEITDYLLSDSKKRDLILIVGMPGLGKTTFAKKMYEDPSIIRHFDVRAWCTISQTFDKEDLLLSILASLVGSDGIDALPGQNLDDKLRKSLRGHRYLIVLDDLWDIKAWDFLVRSLPDDNQKSRVLITSRVVSEVQGCNSKVRYLRRFNENESWELLQKLLLDEESFSQEFQDVGKQIAISSQGLPLVIVMAAGLLAKLDKNIDLWKQIAKSLSPHVFNDSKNQCMAILEPSYKHLPDHLKSCFLYIGAFPEDSEISVRKLKRLWIAEGFVRITKEKSEEDVAEEYLMELISRSLVIATKESSRGGVKVCGVHDILRDFILAKATKESFLQVIGGTGSDISVVYDQRRLSVKCRMENPSSSILRTLSILNLDNHNMSFTYKNFMLLRVLDLGYLQIDETSFGGMLFLIHLRYLAFGYISPSLPSSISKLAYLNYLHVRNHYTENLKIPDSLWDMVELRNVKIDYNAYFEVQRSRYENSEFMHNLETLSSPCFKSQEDAEKLLRRLPKLQKLKCVFMCKNHQFPVLNFLENLVSFKVHFDFDFSGVPYLEKRVFNLPSNLQKLTLSNFDLSGDDISKIGRTVANLKFLKLIHSCWKCQWIVSEEDFPSLKYLKLYNVTNMDGWIASEGSFPNLEQLVLDNLGRLDEIPPTFEDINTLLMITVKDCDPDLDESVRRIQTRREEFKPDFQVSINPRNEG